MTARGTNEGRRLVGHRPRTAVGRWMLAVVVIGVVIAGAVAYRTWLATYHFAEVRRGVLYRDGNRSMRQFEIALGKGNIRTVVMLNDDGEARKEPFASEIELCRQRGVRLVRIPVGLGRRPNTEDVRRFLDVMADKSSHPVLVHCAQGVRRTGMVVAAYQMSEMGLGAGQAKEAVLLWGRKWDRLADVRGFIDDYDAQARAVGSSHIVTREQDAD